MSYTKMIVTDHGICIRKVVDENYYSDSVVISKEAFIEAYNKWIRRRTMSEDMKRLIAVLQSKGQVITTEDVEYIAGVISESEWLGLEEEDE